MTSPGVTNNRDEMRFEIEIDGHEAELEYLRRGDHLVLVHTEVSSELEGRGVGGMLVTAAIEHAQAGGLVVVPECRFAFGWLERHPDVAGRVQIEWPSHEE